MYFQYTISHFDGKSMVISDTLSRAPNICEQSNQEELSCYETEKFVDLVIDSLPATDIRIQKIINKQTADQVCNILKSYCENGWPERKSDLADFMNLTGHFKVK